MSYSTIRRKTSKVTPIAGMCPTCEGREPLPHEFAFEGCFFCLTDTPAPSRVIADIDFDPKQLSA